MQSHHQEHLELTFALRCTEMTATQARILERNHVSRRHAEDAEPLGLASWGRSWVSGLAKTACTILRRHRHSAYANLMRGRTGELGRNPECR